MSKSDLADNLLGNKKDKAVKAENLFIHGNQFQWEGVLIQISNISLITTSNMNAPVFPIWTIFAAIIGIALFSDFSKTWFLSLSLVLVAGFEIYRWYQKNQLAKEQKYLNIILNSGYTYSILFNDQQFLHRVFRVISNIFDEDVSSKVNYHIDMSNCTIDNNSSVVRASR